jgi:metal-responsive CopG/Arc/MetJ family transcriptional regulator
MPKSLHDELKNVAADQHYLDLSEAIRNIIRRNLP